MFKTEPGEFSLGDLEAMAPRAECWSGVRNYQARNLLRDRVAVGDRVLIYHSSCPQPGVAGIARVVRAGYPDPTALQSPAGGTALGPEAGEPRWFAVDVQFDSRLPALVPLAELKRSPALAELPLVKRGNRLSIMPVTEAQWQLIVGWPAVTAGEAT